MHPFDYHRPDSLDAVRALLADDPEALPLAGGMTLIPTLKQRLAAPTALVDLAGIDALRGVRRDGDTLVVGAMTTHAGIAAHPDVRQQLPVLAAAAGGIGDPQVRHRGTLGGAVANNDPAADYPAVVLALGAEVQTTAGTFAADEFFTGMFGTALPAGELIKAIRFPCLQAAAYGKFPNPASGYAMAGVCVARHAHGVRVAVTGAAASVYRDNEMEARLAARFGAGQLDGYAVDSSTFNADLHASPEYRGQLVRVMAQRAVAAITGEPLHRPRAS